MIYTIGIERLTAERLREIMAGIHCTELVDCRTKTAGVKGFSENQLREEFPATYRYKGDVLGSGGPGPTRRGFEWLIERHQADETLLLICKEEAPGNCHRFHRIAKPLYLDHSIECWHIYREITVTTSELQASIAGNRCADMMPLGC